ncbi:hypothetical protein ABZ543_27000 [Streptomyces roseifaciens]
MAAQVHDGETAGQGQDRRHEETCPCRDKEREAIGGSGPWPAMTASGTPPLDDAAMPVFLIEEYESEDDMPPLWEVLMDDQPEFVEELVAAGEDPWEPVLGGWSPGRLSLAGPSPGLFVVPEGTPGLSPDERALVLEAERLRAALADCHHLIGLGLSCVAGIDAQEAHGVACGVTAGHPMVPRYSPSSVGIGPTYSKVQVSWNSGLGATSWI